MQRNSFQTVVEDCARIADELRRNSCRKYRKDREACEGIVSVPRDVLDFLLGQTCASHITRAQFGLSEQAWGELINWTTNKNRKSEDIIKLPVEFIQNLLNHAESRLANFTPEELSIPRKCLHIHKYGGPADGCPVCERWVKYNQVQTNKSRGFFADRLFPKVQISPFHLLLRRRLCISKDKEQVFLSAYLEDKNGEIIITSEIMEPDTTVIAAHQMLEKFWSTPGEVRIKEDAQVASAKINDVQFISYNNFASYSIIVKMTKTSPFRVDITQPNSAM